MKLEMKHSLILALISFTFQKQSVEIQNSDHQMGRFMDISVPPL